MKPSFAFPAFQAASRSLAFATAFALALLTPAPDAVSSSSPPYRPNPQTAVAEATPDKYPNADYIVLRRDTSTTYKADGTAKNLEETSLKIFTEKGRRELRTQTFSYNIFYEDFKILFAQVIKPANSPKKTQEPGIDIAANSKEMIDRSMMGANIYDPDNKVLTLAIPGLEIGDTLLVVTERTTKRPYMANTFFDYQTFESTAPILSLNYTVHAPADRPLKTTALLGKVADTVHYTSSGSTNGPTTHRWTARNIPQAFPEPSMPDLDSCGQRLRISTAANWEEISKWYWDISEPHLKTTPGIDAKVRELTARATTDAEKIRAVFRFVSQEIRYMGITLEKDSPGFEPHDVRITFENRYGVCRDKAALLVTMLRSAGFDAYPVLIMAGPLLDPEVPTPNFNHAITAVRHKDGTYQLMDTTNEHTSDLFPAYLSNKSYLVSHPKGETLHISPVAPPDQNMLRAATRLTLDAAGDATGTVQFDFTGINDNAYRGHFVRQKPEDLRRFFEAVLKGVIPGATLTTLDIQPANMQDPAPIRARLDFAAKNFFPATGTLLPTPWFSEHLAIASRVLGNGTGLEKRRFPLTIPITCGLAETLHIEFPAGTPQPLALPANETIETPALRYTRNFARNGNTLNAALELKLTAPRVDPADYAALKTALKGIEYAGRQQPVFARRDTASTNAATAKHAPDVDILHRDHTVDLQTISQGNYTWTSRITEKRRVNTYAGKKDSGELKVDYNPVWETVKLTSAKVTQADGTERIVKPEEINIMDAPWVASAPRYPAGKTYVVSLPGVEVGALVEYTLERVAKDRPYFYIEKNFFSFDKVHDDNFTLTTTEFLHSDTPNCASYEGPFLKNADGSPPTGKPSNNYRLTYTGKSYGGSEKENALPPLSTFAPTLRLTNRPLAGSDILTSYAAQLFVATTRLIQPTDTIRAKAAEIVKKPSSWHREAESGWVEQEEGPMRELDAQLGKIRAIRDFVAKNIRLDGPSFTALPIRCLTPPDKTLADGYGNEADRAILLASLLTAAGYQPHLVLATNGPTLEWGLRNGYRPPICPVGIFNRLVVSLPFSCPSSPHGGDPVNETLYLDQLSQYADLRATALEGAYAVPLNKELGKTLTIKAEAPSRHLDAYGLQIAENGDAEFTVVQYVTGARTEGFRRRFHEMTPEERNRFQQQLTSSISQAATGGKLGINYSRDSGRLVLQKVKIPRFAVRTGDYLYLDLPEAIREIAAAFTDQRLHPFALSGQVSLQQNRWNITLPKGAEIISAPQPIRWAFPGGHDEAAKGVSKELLSHGFDGVTILVKQGKDVRTGVSTLEVEQNFRRSAPVIIPADNYSSLLDINRKLSTPSQWQVLVKLKSSEKGQQ